MLKNSTLRSKWNLSVVFATNNVGGKIDWKGWSEYVNPCFKLQQLLIDKQIDHEKNKKCLGVKVLIF